MTENINYADESDYDDGIDYVKDKAIELINEILNAKIEFLNNWDTPPKYLSYEQAVKSSKAIRLELIKIKKELIKQVKKIK